LHSNLVAFSPDELGLVVRKALRGSLDAPVRSFEIRYLAQITVDPAADDDAANGAEALGTRLSAQAGLTAGDGPCPCRRAAFQILHIAQSLVAPFARDHLQAAAALGLLVEGQ